MLMKAVMPKKFQLNVIPDIRTFLFPDGGEIHYRRVRHFACTVRSR